ncbi:DUF1415 domain-containing protein [Thalassotalea crassostreae]|uniref:DUF1415 domain-containing protein n=1 Tax=Thalassotalea crassostreae TaxID=1763536 RepID=UPI0008397EE6|nr:DUF1415 domain-containing protein [Thalassotalea crassostreae]
MYSDKQIINQCKAWIEDLIIGLNFCPFAKKEFVQNTIAYPIFRNVDIESALESVINQCQTLDQNNDIETALLIYPEQFRYFDDYLDFLSMAEQLIIEQGYEGVYQIASFHPDYYFADVDPSDVSNYTNRAPFPILHLIREASMERVIAVHPDVEGIPQRNMSLCEQKGEKYFIEYFKQLAHKDS